MASKHAALYFEAYKQHHLVCSSLHTLSCEVSRVQGGGGGNGRVPALSSASSESEAKDMCMQYGRFRETHDDTASRPTMQMLYPVQTTYSRIALAANARYIRIRLVLGITDGCRSRNPTGTSGRRHTLLDFLRTSTHARTHARTHAND